MLFSGAGDQTHLKGRLETSYQSIEPLSTALRATVWATEQHRVCTQRVRLRLFAIPSRDATAGDDEALPIAAH